MRAPRAEVGLPCPTVRFAADFVRRLERLALRVASARERREGQGGAALAGAGEEFVGYRPYRPGEDLHHLDWSLLARLDRPYVRVSRREASEHWAVLVDDSASMGVGPPGKLQAAAEVACGLACVGLRQGAQVEIVASGGESFNLRRLTDLPGLLAFFEGLVARGDRGLAQLLGRRRLGTECGRAFLVGDLCDLDPRAVLALARPGRDLLCAQVLAPVELAPRRGARVEWVDPEGGGRLPRTLDGPTLAAYERALEERLAAWDRLAARHGFTHHLFPSDRPFEEAVRGMLWA